MSTTPLNPFDLCARLKSRERMFGTFLKFPTTQVIEILGGVGFDFVIIDQEHAPLDPAMTDLMILAARASGVAPLVRIRQVSEADILSVLDCGASGILVPHVDSVDKAERIARACRYRSGNRGFVGMSRAAAWGQVSKSDHIARQDAEIACIAMIEDPHAVPLASEIAGVEGIDAVFVGQGDLGAALEGEADVAARVAELLEETAAALRQADVPLLMIPNGPGGVGDAHRLGAQALILSSDHGFLKSAAASALKDHRGA